MKIEPENDDRPRWFRSIIIIALALAALGLFQLKIIHQDFSIISKYIKIVDTQNKAIESSTQVLHEVGDTYTNLLNQHKQDQLKLEIMDQKLKRAYNGIERLQCRLQYVTDGHLHLCDIEDGGEPE